MQSLKMEEFPLKYNVSNILLVDKIYFKIIFFGQCHLHSSFIQHNWYLISLSNYFLLNDYYTIYAYNEVVVPLVSEQNIKIFSYLNLGSNLYSSTEDVYSAVENFAFSKQFLGKFH